MDTDDNGEFVIDYLPAGMYRLNIEYPDIPMDENSFAQFTIDENRSSYNLEAVINESDIEVTDVTVLSIGKQLAGLKIFSNPSSDFVQIDLKEANVSQDVVLEVFDNAGRSIMSKVYGNKRSLIEIDIRRLRMGSYHLKMNVGDWVYSYHLLVNR